MSDTTKEIGNRTASGAAGVMPRACFEPGDEVIEDVQGTKRRRRVAEVKECSFFHIPCYRLEGDISWQYGDSLEKANAA
jgi:hypothetical protein